MKLRACCYELISLGVSTSQLPKILQVYCKYFQITLIKIPRPSWFHNLRWEMGVISQNIARKRIQGLPQDTPVVYHHDQTSRNSVSFQANCLKPADQPMITVGISPVLNGTAGVAVNSLKSDLQNVTSDGFQVSAICSDTCNTAKSIHSLWCKDKGQVPWIKCLNHLGCLGLKKMVDKLTILVM